MQTAPAPSDKKRGKPFYVHREGSVSVTIYRSSNIIPQRDAQGKIIYGPPGTNGKPKALVKYQSDIYTLTYQGGLPNLLARPAVAHVTSGAPAWIAVQEATGLTGPGTAPWRGVGRLYDPRSAVRVGDLVEIAGFPGGVCPGGTFELVVTALRPPDPLLHPGGAVGRSERENRVGQLRLQVPLANRHGVLRHFVLGLVRDDQLARQRLAARVDPELPVDGRLFERQVMARHARGFVNPQVHASLDVAHQPVVHVGIEEVGERDHGARLVEHPIELLVDRRGYRATGPDVLLAVEG